VIYVTSSLHREVVSKSTLAITHKIKQSASVHSVILPQLLRRISRHIFKATMEVPSFRVMNVNTWLLQSTFSYGTKQRNMKVIGRFNVIYVNTAMPERNKLRNTRQMFIVISNTHVMNVNLLPGIKSHLPRT